MTSRNRALLAGAAWGVLIAAAIVAVSFAFRDRLPSPLATHWGSGMQPDGNSGFTAILLSVLGMWALFWVVLMGIAVDGRAFARRLSRAYWWAALIWSGAFVAVMHLSTILANLDAPAWTDARLSAWSVAAVVTLPFALGALAGFLGRGEPDQPTPAGEAPPQLRLRAGQRSVWVSRVTNAWLYPLSVVPLAVAVVAAVLWLTGVMPPQIAAIVVPLMFVAAAAGIATCAVTVRVSDDGVAIGFGPFGWPVRRIRLSKIESAWAEERFPSQVGGWGFRGVPGMAAIMIRGGECLVLRYHSGGQLVVSIDDATRGASLLNALIQERVS